MTTNPQSIAAPPECRKCGVELSEENWYSSRRRKNERICKGCHLEYDRQWRRTNPEKAKANTTTWRHANPEKAKAISTRGSRKRGERPMNENKACPAYLGVHVAERVLRYAFKDVKQMPYGNPGFDFVCSRGKKVDVKSSCLRRDGTWMFTIKRNTIADYFLCLAFDSREALNPQHVWLIPGSVVNHLTGTGISPSTIDRWDAYRQDMSKINACCDTMKGVEL